ncbi:hypothetical protein OIY24_006851, partial [Pseudomonas aeruginosa]
RSLASANHSIGPNTYYQRKERAARLKKNEISCMGTFRLSLARTIATKRRGNDAHNLKIPME